jgi:Mn2+/Fe2+ NRAMP family transporter
MIKILFLSQALNAVLLLVLLPFMRSFGQDESLMGTHALGSAGRVATGVALALIVVSVLSLAVLTVAKGRGRTGRRVKSSGQLMASLSTT